MLITVQPDPNWQLSLAQLSPSLFFILIKSWPNFAKNTPSWTYLTAKTMGFSKVSKIFKIKQKLTALC